MDTAIFTYNGQLRIVLVHKNTKTFIQGQNLHNNATIEFATYSKDKMVNPVYRKSEFAK